ncbi:hypothetical protein [Geodermatophilus normandii]|uniref:hypothetical protein n=1 Tax=Geodermatophilus normandii TaxID=1137989 RepID=UPI00195457AD|nr:hypothetical protein [Geodermatophilus normandii]
METWPVQTWPVPTWPCPTCGEDRLFEQPPCADGHTDDDGECPEWLCTDCGGAFLLGGVHAVVPAAVRRAA